MAEKKAKEEIEKLRRELELLKKKPGPVPAPKPVPKPQQPKPQPSNRLEPLSKTPLIDALLKMQESINKSKLFIFTAFFIKHNAFFLLSYHHAQRCLICLSNYF